MSLKNILEKCKQLEIYEERSIADDYLELVFYNKDLTAWNKLISESLEAPIKPQGIEPNQEHLQLTENFGSIRQDQTLFKKQLDQGYILAMFWPWQDGVHTTFKAAFVNK